jgi:DNA-binding transcriptional ArsR family regulator
LRGSTLTLDDTLLALADPTRRAILEHLSRGEARVTDVAEPFAISLNSVSKHIRLLERAGLIRRDVRGREHVLSFNAGPLDHAAEWIEHHRAVWRGRLRARDALLHEEERARRPRARDTKVGHDRVR